MRAEIHAPTASRIILPTYFKLPYLLFCLDNSPFILYTAARLRAKFLVEALAFSIFVTLIHHLYSGSKVFGQSFVIFHFRDLNSPTSDAGRELCFIFAFEPSYRRAAY